MKNLKLATIFAAALALAACGESGNSSEAAEAAQSEIVASESVAEAAQRPWPSPSDVPIDAYDPKRTRDNLMVVLDASGSMDGSHCSGEHATKMDAARAALDAWMSGVPADANVGLVVFVDGTPRVRVPLGYGPQNRADFRSVVEQVWPNGGTPLSSALDMAERELEKQARYQQGYGSYRVVMITDGEHNAGYDPRPVVERVLSNPANPVEIHTVGFCVDEDHALNQPGLTYYRSAKNPEQLKAGLDEVLAESESFDVQNFDALAPQAD